MRPNKRAAPCIKTEAAISKAYFRQFNYNSHFSTKQLRGINGYEKLRAEWIAANPEHGELELLTACIGFARACGLVLREKLIAASIRELGGDHEHP